MKRLLVIALVAIFGLTACAGPSTTPTAAPAATGTSAPAATNAATAAPSATSAATPASNDTAAPRDTAAPSETAAPQASATATGTGPVGFQEFASGFDLPLLVTHAGDGSGRLFVVEQSGLIRILQNGATLPDPFLDLTGLVTHGGNEQGLLGLAFAPDYASSGLFYVDYTDGRGDTQVVRYKVSDADANRANPDRAETLLTVHQPFENHNGGNLAFGPDGFLYVGLGDGGSQGDPNGNGQNLKVLLGKLLRLDVSAGTGAYSVPPSNPFVGRAGARGEVWAYGLRNPWRFSFDMATGDLFIGDVGQNTYEEVDYQPAASKGGEDYGWNFREASHAFEGTAPQGLALVEPVAEYSHAEGGCSVTGGYVYRGPSLPDLDGVYFYGDYCTGIIWTLTQTGGTWQKATFAGTDFTISSFGQDEAGELYLCDHRAGVIYMLARGS